MAGFSLCCFASVPLSVEKGSPVRNPIYQKLPGPMDVRILELNENLS